MTKPILIESANTIKLDKLVVAKLCEVSGNIPYVTKKDMTFHCHRDGNIDDIYGQTMVSTSNIIIKKPAIEKIHTPKYVEELLTGIKLPYASISEYPESEGVFESSFGFETRHRELDLFVCTDRSRRTPITKELLEYIENHEDIELYRQYLEELKRKCLYEHLKTKQSEKENKQLVKKMYI